MKFGVHSRRSGFTLLEMVVATTIFGMVGIAITAAFQVGRQSQSVVAELAAEGDSMRAATSQLVDDLRATRDASIVVTGTNTQNHMVTLMQPIVVDADLSWGVFEPRLSADPDEQTRENWRVCYRVDSVVSFGVTTRTLVRQILNETGAVQFERTVLRGLRAGNAASPGFQLRDVGDVWELTVSTENALTGAEGMRMVLHVRTRN